MLAELSEAPGQRVRLSELAELTNAEGKSVALATGSSMYLPGRPANLVGVELGSGSSDPEDDPGA